MLKVHPNLSLLRERAGSSSIEVIEGYVSQSDEENSCLQSEIAGGVSYRFPTKAILHDEAAACNTDGKIRVYLREDTKVEIVVQTTVASMRQIKGTYCADSGTSYCWRRTRLPDGTVIIIMKPCGTCVPASSGGLSDMMAN